MSPVMNLFLSCPTVAAIINRMELHLVKTYTHIHTHAHTRSGPDSQVSDYEAPSVSGPSLARRCVNRVFVCVCVCPFQRFVRCAALLWLSPEALLADTGVAVDGVHALRPVLALVLQTVIVVLLAVLAHVTRQTLAPRVAVKCYTRTLHRVHGSFLALHQS